MPNPPSPTEPPDNVIALSRYRAQLGRGRRARRADEFFATEHPNRAIRALPPDEFFYVISEAGFPDALEMMQYGTPEQLQVALDFVLWERDQLSVAAMDEWLGAMAEAPGPVLAAWLAGLDVELLALMLRKRARIYDKSLEEVPDDPEGTFLDTPDGLFTLDLLGEEEEVAVTARLLDAMYRDDRDRARRMLVGMRAELDSELEELAFRWRSGRMADLGFVDFYDALEVYRVLDPATVTVGERPVPRTRPATGAPGDAHLRLPDAIAERLAGGSPFARAIGAVTSAEELGELHFALVALSNRVLSADRVPPGDQPRITETLIRMAATLDLAVELLARGDEERAVAAVRTVPLVQLFRLGVSLIGKVQRLARALARQTPFARHGLELFEPEDAEVVKAAGRLRPLFPRRLDDPPAAGERPFGSLADVATVTAALERAGAAVALVHGLGVRPEQLVEPALGELHVRDAAALDTAVLARTAIGRRLVGGRPGPLRPLTGTELHRLEELLGKAGRGPSAAEPLVRAIRAILSDAAPGGALTPAMTAIADRWTATFLPLEPVLTTDGPRPAA